VLEVQVYRVVSRENVLTKLSVAIVDTLLTTDSANIW